MIYIYRTNARTSWFTGSEKKDQCNMLILDFFSIRFMFHSLEKTVSVQLNR
jgi:hypothetical protein